MVKLKKILGSDSGGAGANTLRSLASGELPSLTQLGEIFSNPANPWANPFVGGPNQVSSLSSLFAAPGSVGEFAAFSDAPFSMISEAGIGASGGAGSSNILSGISPALKTLGIAGAVLGGVKFLDSIRWGKGGASESAKAPKMFNEIRSRLQSDPSGNSMNSFIEAIVQNRQWGGEENRDELQQLINQDVIGYDYAPLHSSNSIYNMWDVSLNNVPKMYENRQDPESSFGESAYYYKRGIERDNTNPVMLDMIAGAYGLNAQQAARYKELVNATNNKPSDMGLHAKVNPKLVQEREAFENTYLTEARKKATARSMLQTLRGRGYTGDLAHLTQYLRG